MTIAKVVFVGSKPLGVKVLNAVYALAPQSLAGLVTFDDSSDARSALPQFEEFEKRTGKPLRVLKNGSGLASVVQELQPELCLVVGWYWVLKPEILRSVPHGWLGIHASLLPKYRGGAPLVWALINGESETGLSLFYFDEGMDTGDVVAQRRITIGPQDTIADLLSRTEQESTDMIREVYPLLLLGKAPRVQQDHSKATYVSLRNSADGRIDWRQPAIRVYDFIRAQTHPYPGAFFYFEDRLIRVWSAKLFEYPYFGAPGQVVMVTGDSVVVTCGEGTGLSLVAVQPEDGEQQMASELLKFGQRLN